MGQRLAGAAGVEGHAAEGHAVVEVDAEGAGFLLVSDDSLPAGVVFGADDHVGIATGSALRGEGQSLGSGGRHHRLELAGVGAGLGEFETPDFVAARCLEVDGHAIGSGGLALINIGEAEVNLVARAHRAGAECGLGAGQAEFLDVELPLALAGREGTCC